MLVVILWTPCRGQASDCEEKCNTPGMPETRCPKKTKNSTIEASRLLKTQRCVRNEAKKYLKIKQLYVNEGRGSSKYLQEKDIGAQGCRQERTVCAPISANRVPNGAKSGAFCENEVRLGGRLHDPKIDLRESGGTLILDEAASGARMCSAPRRLLHAGGTATTPFGGISWPSTFPIKL